MATEKNFKIKNGLSIGDDEVISSVRRFYASDGTSAKAAYSFDGDSNTGMYHYGTDQIGFTAGGNLMAYIQSGATYGLVVQSKISATGGNSDNWNTAYGWGDHSTQGYLTSADLSGYLTSESDTLASVTGRGNTTTNSISVGAITSTGNSTFANLKVTETGKTQYIHLYLENGTANIADDFTDTTTQKSYIYLNGGVGSNDPGFIMHETADSNTADQNKGVLHLVPSDDNSTNDYVSIHGTDDADCLRLDTAGRITTASNYRLTLSSGNSSVYILDSLEVEGGVDLNSLAQNGTTRIDSSGNATFGTISSGAITSNGNLTVEGTQGFNATGETASIYLGDTASEIRATYNGGTKFFVNGTDRMEIEGSTGNLNLKTGNLKVDNTTVIDSNRNITNVKSLSVINTNSTGQITNDAEFRSWYQTETSPRVRIGRDVGVSGGAGIALGGTGGYVTIGTNNISGSALYFKLNSAASIVTSAPDMVLQKNTTIDSQGPYDWLTVGSGSRAASLRLNDITGANYILRAGNYDLSFMKHVDAATDYFVDVMKFVAAGVTDTSVDVQIFNGISANTTNSGSNYFHANSSDGRTLRLRDRSANGGNIVQFESGNGTQIWELVGRDGTFYIYKNTGTGSGLKWQIDSSGDHTITGNATLTAQSNFQGLIRGTRAATSANVDYLRMEMPSWSGHTSYLKSLTWHDGSNNISAIGAEYDGSKTNIHFHSQYNAAYKGTGDKTFSVYGNGNVNVLNNFLINGTLRIAQNGNATLGTISSGAITSSGAVTANNFITTGSTQTAALSASGEISTSAGVITSYSSIGGTFYAENTSTGIASGVYVGGFLFKNSDTSGTAPHYAGMTAVTQNTDGGMQLQFFADRADYESVTPAIRLYADGVDSASNTLDLEGITSISDATAVTTTGNVTVGNNLIINGTTRINSAGVATLGTTTTGALTAGNITATSLSLSGAFTPTSIAATSTVSGSQFRASYGSETAPAFTFKNDDDTGMYGSANRIHFAVSGDEKIQVQPSSIILFESTTIQDELKVGTIPQTVITSARALQNVTAITISGPTPTLTGIDTDLTTRRWSIGGENGNCTIEVDPNSAQSSSFFNVKIDNTERLSLNGDRLQLGNVIAQTSATDCGIAHPRENLNGVPLEDGLAYFAFNHNTSTHPSTEVSFDTMERTNITTFKESGTWDNAASFTLSADSYLTEFHGYVLVSTAGAYRFGISADDATDLYIDGVRVADHYGGHGATGFVNTNSLTEIYLDVGYHKVFARFEEISGGDSIQLGWNGGSGTTLSAIPAANLYHDAEDRFKSYDGTIYGVGNLTMTANVTAYSDEKLKSDIETLDGSKVYDMRGVSFTKDGQAGSGVIAQELEKVAPELVHDGEYKSVAYGNLVGYLIEAVKDQKEIIDNLTQRIEEIEHGNN